MSDLCGYQMHNSSQIHIT